MLDSDGRDDLQLIVDLENGKDQSQKRQDCARLLTSFSPNEKTGTRSALSNSNQPPAHAQPRNSLPLPHGNLDKAQPLPQRQIIRSRMRRQTLRRSTHDDGDGASRTLAEDVGAGLFGDAT
jgi:hypothetical protein